MLLALGAGRLARRLKPARLEFRLLLSVGTPLLAFGVLVGPVMGIVSRDALSALTPFIALGLGWTGMLVGAQLDRRQLALFSGRLAVATVIQAVVAFAVSVALAALVFVAAGHIQAWAPDGPAVLTMAVVTAVSAPAAMALVSQTIKTQGPVGRLLSYMSTMDGVVGIVLLTAVFAYTGMPARIGLAGALSWLAVALLVGVLVGLVFLSLTRARPNADELVLYLAGCVLFGSGVATAMHVPPLGVCFVAGVVIANLSRFAGRTYATLATWERPVYGLFLILAGAMLRPPGWGVVPLTAALLLVRVVAKGLGAWTALRMVSPGPAPRRLGLGLFPHGGLALVLVMAYAVAYGAASPVADTVVAAVVLAVAISDLVGPYLVRHVLGRAGELDLGAS